MRKIVIPQGQIILSNGEMNQTSQIDFKSYVERLLDNSLYFGRGIARARAAMKILDALEKSEKAGFIEVADEDWSGMVEALESPVAPWHPRFARITLRFAEAIVAAEKA